MAPRNHDREPYNSHVCVSAVNATGRDGDLPFCRILSTESEYISVEFIMYHKFKPEIRSHEDRWVGKEIIGSTLLHRRINVPTIWFDAQDMNSLGKRVRSRIEVPFGIGDADDLRWGTEPLGYMAERLMDERNRMVDYKPGQQFQRMAVFLVKVTLLPPRMFDFIADVAGSRYKEEFVWRLDLRVLWAESKVWSDTATRKLIIQVMQDRVPRLIRDVKWLYEEDWWSSEDSTITWSICQRKVTKSEENPIITCAICLDEVKIRSLVPYIPCFHNFHEDCLRRWQLRNNTCPICRFPFD